jgi:CheY-like chemotaxis protein/signal transduction histidine kinase
MLLVGMGVFILMVQIFYAFTHLPRWQFDSDDAQMLRVLDQSEYALRHAQNLTSGAQTCLSQGPCEDSLMSEAHVLLQALSNFKHVSGKEKKWLSLSGLTHYDLLELSTRKFIEQGDRAELLAALELSIPLLNESHQRLVESLAQTHKAIEQEFNYMMLLLTAVAILCFVLSYLSFKVRFTLQKHSYADLHKRLDHTSEAVVRWEVDTFKEQLNSSDLSELERRVYTKILAREKEIEDRDHQLNLYRELYSMIGFEIRSITHTIQGGLKVLTKDTDEHGVFLAHEISLATDMLDGLAENFNRLLSSGQSSQSARIDIHYLLSNLSSTLSSKIRRANGKLECFVDPMMPTAVFGNQIAMFWMLLFYMSNAVAIKKSPQAFLNIRCRSSENIDKISLQFELIFLDASHYSISTLNDSNWELEPQQSNQSVSNTLMEASANFSATWSTAELKPESELESDDGETHKVSKLSINIDVTPHTYADKSLPLEGKRILICGDSPLQCEIIQRTTEHYGAQIDWARSPNDIFKLIAKAADYNAFLVTDTVPGIELTSFCKTLNSRLKKISPSTHLLLSVSDPELAESAHEYVDHIFYRPSDTESFIRKLATQIESENEDAAADAHRVLIVEDDEIQQIILSQLLSEFSIDCDTANSGEEALEHLAQNTPSMVFMDCIMPGMGGIEATRRIRADDGTLLDSHVTIIGATALSGIKERKECIDAGMDYVITKPYKNEEIVKVIKNYLAVRKLN